MEWEERNESKENQDTLHIWEFLLWFAPPFSLNVKIKEWQKFPVSKYKKNRKISNCPGVKWLLRLLICKYQIRKELIPSSDNCRQTFAAFWIDSLEDITNLLVVPILIYFHFVRVDS